VVDAFDARRRLILGAALSGVAALDGLQVHAQTKAGPRRASPLQKLAPLRHVETDLLNVAYYEEGPATGPAAILLHGFPYDVHTYADVAPILAARGCRVIVPYLRGYGETRFRDMAAPRSGEQAALGADVVALTDALGLKRAIFAGHNWGGRAATVAAALWPDRCSGLVTVNSYLIQNLSRAMVPSPPENEEAMWYEYYFQLERGRAGLAANRRRIARMLWEEWSPDWDFDDATFDRSMPALDNPDFVDVAIHSYRHRFGNADGDPRYAEFAKRLAAIPPITVPAVTLDGDSDGVVAASDGSATAAKFTARRIHRVVKGAGHNVPQEAPAAFAAAVMELVKV
jgi:pimeloyl-ACP methyl ester carboxylesterase